MIFIINKKVWGIDVYVGISAGHFWSEAEAFGKTSINDDWDYCYMFSLAYYWKISNLSVWESRVNILWYHNLKKLSAD